MNLNELRWLMRGMILTCVLIGTVCFLTSGCGLTLGPRTETRTVVVNVGKPVQILENRRLKALEKESGEQVEVDVGGWIAMPKGHWEEWVAYLGDLLGRIDHLKHTISQLEAQLAIEAGRNRG